MTVKEGIYEKYQVSRTDGKDDEYKTDYFVLNLIGDPHARAALLTYAKSCKDDKPRLAVDLLLKLSLYN